LLKAALRPVVGHADWEAQNMRWAGTEPYVVYDWDSLDGFPRPPLSERRRECSPARRGRYSRRWKARWRSWTPMRSRAVARSASRSAKSRGPQASGPLSTTLAKEILHDVPSVALTALDQQADNASPSREPEPIRRRTFAGTATANQDPESSRPLVSFGEWSRGEWGNPALSRNLISAQPSPVVPRQSPFAHGSHPGGRRFESG
jgi:hypothetical protein